MWQAGDRDDGLWKGKGSGPLVPGFNTTEEIPTIDPRPTRPFQHDTKHQEPPQHQFMHHNTSIPTRQSNYHNRQHFTTLYNGNMQPNYNPPQHQYQQTNGGKGFQQQQQVYDGYDGVYVGGFYRDPNAMLMDIHHKDVGKPDTYAGEMQSGRLGTKE